jgi:hypothetical protein
MTSFVSDENALIQSASAKWILFLLDDIKLRESLWKRNLFLALFIRMTFTDQLKDAFLQKLHSVLSESSLLFTLQILVSLSSVFQDLMEKVEQPFFIPTFIPLVELLLKIHETIPEIEDSILPTFEVWLGTLKQLDCRFRVILWPILDCFIKVSSQILYNRKIMGHWFNHSQFF